MKRKEMLYICNKDNIDTNPTFKEHGLADDAVTRLRQRGGGKGKGRWSALERLGSEGQGTKGEWEMLGMLGLRCKKRIIYSCQV